MDGEVEKNKDRSLSTVLSRAPAGLGAPQVRVEVHLGAGLPAFIIVGLPETVVRESKERVRSAILNSGTSFPMVGSPLIWRLPICRKKAGDSICPSPWESWQPATR